MHYQTGFYASSVLRTGILASALFGWFLSQLDRECHILAFSQVSYQVGFYTNSTENFTYQRSRKYVVLSVFTLTELNEPVLTGITLYERTSAYQQCYASISTGSAAPVDVRAVIATVGRRWWLKESLNHCGGGPLM